MLKNRGRQGSVSMEVIVGIALSIVVLFITLGLFSDNLSNMISSSNIKNIFTGDRTLFASFNRDYTDSQVDVQVMGEQGLELLRQKANNLALDLIENPYSSANENASSIAYLALVIQAIVGEPHICLYMEKESTLPCKDSSIGGYTYKIKNIGSSTISVDKVDKDGNVVLADVQIPVGDSSATTVLSSALAELNSLSGGSSTVASGASTSALTEDNQYNFIQELSTNIEPYDKANVRFMKKNKTFKSIKKLAFLNNPAILKGDLLDLYNSGIKDLSSTANVDAGQNNFWGYGSGDPDGAIDYILYGDGKTATLTNFKELLQKVNTAALNNLHMVYDNSLGASVIDKAAEYATAATYNKFIYNISDISSYDGVQNFSLRCVNFYNNGEHEIENGAGRISGQSRIAYSYDVDAGPGKGVWDASLPDWVASAVSYADTRQVVIKYFVYFAQYCTQNVKNIRVIVGST